VFANRLDIRELNLVTLEYKQVLPNTTNSVAIDIDMAHDVIFWTDHAHESIQRTDLRTNKTTILLNTSSISTPDGLAFDWIHKNLYWTDTGLNNIRVISTKYSGADNGPKTLLSDQDEPRAIVVDPIKTMRLYYTDWGSNPHIGSAGLDGSDARRIFEGPEVAWPNGLTLDLLHRRLYWVDAKLHILSSIDTSGNDPTRIPTHLSDLSHPFAITLFEDTLYWTDWHTDAIYQANKFNATGARIMAAGLHSPMDLHVVHPSKQPDGENRCNNAHCSHICLPAPGERQYLCACPDHLELNSDMKTCVSKKQVTSSTATSKATTTSKGSSEINITTTSTTTPSSTAITSNEEANKATTTDKKSPTGHIMWAVMLILAAAAIVIALVIFVIYRKYSRRTSRSMNFDNPVYKKTTDEDKVSLSRQDSFYIDAPAQPYVDA
jgi:sugar lactone lactonase YvrE